MKTEIEILKNVTGFIPAPDSQIHINHVVEAMQKFANQFRIIRTTSGEEIFFDDQDYFVLRNNTLFLDKQRKVVLTTGNSKNNNRTGIPIAKIMLGLEGNSVIKYKDANGLNLRRSNIEVISHQKAIFNKKIGKNNTSGYKGVSWNKNAKRYSADIKVEGKKKFLGYFHSAHDAALEYNRNAILYYGEEYAFLNKISWDKKIQ